MARTRYKTTIVRRLRQLGACGAGLQYVTGKTFDQAWENCPSAGFYIWWIQMVWKRWPERRAHYFEDGHLFYTLVTAQALDTASGIASLETRALNSAVHEAPTFLRRVFRLTAKRWAKDQGHRARVVEQVVDQLRRAQALRDADVRGLLRPEW